MTAQVPARPYPWPFDAPATAANTALLLLGFQQAAISEIGEPAEAALARAATLAGRCTALGLPLFATRRGLPADWPLSPVQRWRQSLPQPDRVLLRGARGWDLADELAGQQVTAVIDHPGDNALFDSPLVDLLACRGIRNLLVTGLRTEGIVHATMRDANDRGYECLLVADACASDMAAHHATILSVTVFGNGLFGTVATADQVLDCPAFTKVSA